MHRAPYAGRGGGRGAAHARGGCRVGYARARTVHKLLALVPEHHEVQRQRHGPATGLGAAPAGAARRRAAPGAVRAGAGGRRARAAAAGGLFCLALARHGHDLEELRGRHARRRSARPRGRRRPLGSAAPVTPCCASADRRGAELLPQRPFYLAAPPQRPAMQGAGSARARLRAAQHPAWLQQSPMRLQASPVMPSMQSRAVQEARASSNSCASQGTYMRNHVQAVCTRCGPCVRAARTSGNSTSPEPSASTSASISVTCGQAGAPVAEVSARVCSAAGAPPALHAAKRLLGAFEPHGLSAQLHIQAGLQGLAPSRTSAWVKESKADLPCVGCTNPHTRLAGKDKHPLLFLKAIRPGGCSCLPNWLTCVLVMRRLSSRKACHSSDTSIAPLPSASISVKQSCASTSYYVYIWMACVQPPGRALHGGRRTLAATIVQELTRISCKKNLWSTCSWSRSARESSGRTALPCARSQSKTEALTLAGRCLMRNTPITPRLVRGLTE